MKSKLGIRDLFNLFTALKEVGFDSPAVKKMLAAKEMLKLVLETLDLKDIEVRILDSRQFILFVNGRQRQIMGEENMKMSILGKHPNLKVSNGSGTFRCFADEKEFEKVKSEFFPQIKD